jgi:uridine kinase
VRSYDRAVAVIGICGGSGCGKTFLAEALRAHAPRHACVVAQDSYYRDRSGWTEAMHRELSFDEPEAIDFEALERDVRALAGGHAVDVPRYCFETHARLAERVRVEPRPLVVVEGTLVFSRPGLRDACDLRLYLDAAPDVRLVRRLRRDVEERGRSMNGVIAQYLETVRPMHERWVAPQAAHAHRVVDALATPVGEVVEWCLREIERRVSA